MHTHILCAHLLPIGPHLRGPVGVLTETWALPGTTRSGHSWPPCVRVRACTHKCLFESVDVYLCITVYICGSPSVTVGWAGCRDCGNR